MRPSPGAAQPAPDELTSTACVPQMAVWPSGVMRSAAQDVRSGDDGPEKMTRLAAIRSPLGAVVVSARSRLCVGGRAPGTGDSVTLNSRVWSLPCQERSPMGAAPRNEVVQVRRGPGEDCVAW